MIPIHMPPSWFSHPLYLTTERLFLTRLLLGTLSKDMLRVALQILQRLLWVRRLSCIGLLIVGLGLLAFLGIGLGFWLGGLAALVWCGHIEEVVGAGEG